MAIFSYTLVPDAVTPSVSTVPVDVAKAQLFGRDLKFDTDFHLDAGGDYQLLEYMEALRQAIYNRLLVAPGEFAFRPEYGAGIRQFVKRRIVKSELDSIRQRVIDQLSQDDRITKVIECVVESYSIGDKPGLKVYVKILAAGQEIRLPMTFQER